MEVARLRASRRGKTLHFAVYPQQPRTVGRASSCSVRLRDPKVSRSHCQLAFENGKVVVTDLGSSHGLVYRGQSFQTFAIEIGDGFHVGETFIRFDGIDVNAAPPETVPAARPPGARAAGPTLPSPSAPSAPSPDQDDDDDDDGDDDDDSWPDDPAPQEPAMATVQDYPAIEPQRRGRSRKKKGPSLIVQLIGFFLAFVMTVMATIAVLLFAKDKYGWDVYTLKDWLRNTLQSPPPAQKR